MHRLSLFLQLLMLKCLWRRLLYQLFGLHPSKRHHATVIIQVQYHDHRNDDIEGFPWPNVVYTTPSPLPHQTFWWVLYCKDTIPNIQNKYSQTRNCAASVPISTCMCLWAIYIFPRSVCLFCCRKIYVMILEIYKSLTDTCMNVGSVTEAEQFLFSEHMNGIFVAVWFMLQGLHSGYTVHMKRVGSLRSVV